MKSILINGKYPDKFKSGDVAIAKEKVTFCNGEVHLVGQKITVTEDTKSYYNVWHHIYDKYKNER